MSQSETDGAADHSRRLSYRKEWVAYGHDLLQEAQNQQGRNHRIALKERLDYGQNPDKTEGGELISSYGCDHMTADAEFLLSKAKHGGATTGREQRVDADVLCYQIRQSFKPGEITPEEFPPIGQKRHALDKGQVCSSLPPTQTRRTFTITFITLTSLDCTRKFRDFIGSGRAVRRLSDRICLEK